MSSNYDSIVGSVSDFITRISIELIDLVRTFFATDELYLPIIKKVNNTQFKKFYLIESGIYYISADNLTINQRNSENLCKLDCYLTYEQASSLVDFADPEYEHKLLSLITIHDIIPQESLKILLKSNNFDNLSTLILQKQEV
jgi:hypothetical protein